MNYGEYEFDSATEAEAYYNEYIFYEEECELVDEYCPAQGIAYSDLYIMTPYERRILEDDLRTYGYEEWFKRNKVEIFEKHI